MAKEISNWVDHSMYTAEPMPGRSGEEFTQMFPAVTLLSATPDPLGALGAMAAVYEGRIIRNLGELSDDDRRHYWEQVNKTHLKAPMEAIDLHFLVENVTRAFTHQMVRQRTAVYAQESLRFAVKEHVAARPGPLISKDPKKRRAWDQTISEVWNTYKWLIENGVPAEEARGLLPHDTLTRLHYKTNLRNLAEHLGNRLCTQAQFEWRLVGAQLKQAIADYPQRNELAYGDRTKGNGWQFEFIAESDLFRPVCFAMGKCPFQADFDRGCTIRERMDTGRQDEVRLEEWLMDPMAAWQ